MLLQLHHQNLHESNITDSPKADVLCIHFNIPCNSVKAFPEMRLYSLWISGLWEYLQELIIREEVEAREDKSLGL